MGEFFGGMLAEPQPFARQAEVRVPLHPPVAPILVPIGRRIRMAEEFDFHLLELARAEREVAWRDLVSETLANLCDAKRHPHSSAVTDVLEVGENSLSRLGSQECRILFTTHR